MPAELDAVQSQIAARAEYAHQANKKLTENIQEIFRRYAKTPEGKMKFRKNAKGQYIDKDGNVVDVSKFIEELNNKKFQPVSVADFIKEAKLAEIPGGGRYQFPQDRYLSGSGATYSPADLQQMIDWETAGTKPVVLPNIMRTLKGPFLPPNLLKPFSADDYNNALLEKGLVPNEEFAPYKRYPNDERFEPFNKEQQAIMAEAEGLPKVLAAAKGLPALQGAAVPGHQTREILNASKQFMQPTEDLFNAWEQEAAKQYKDRAAREINPRFIKSGTWGSGPHRDLTSKYFEENQKNLARMKLEHLQKAREFAHNTGAKAYEMRQKDIGDLANEETNSFRKNLVALGTREALQKQRQDLGQKQRDFDYAEFVKEKEHPIRQAMLAANLNNNVQHNVPLETTNVNFAGNPAASQPGTSSTMGGLGLMGAAMLAKAGQGGFKEGGAVYKKNYAPGGSITSKFPMFNNQSRPSFNQSSLAPLTPTDLVRSRVQQEHGGGIGDLFKGMSFQMDRPKPTDAELDLNTPELNSYRQRASQLERAPFNPFWDSVGAFGAGMLGSGGKNTNEMIAGGGTKAWDAFNQAYDKREDNRDKIVNLNKAIQDTRQIQMDREMNYRHQRDNLNLDRIKATSEERRANQRLGFDEKKLALEYAKLETKEKKPLKLNREEQNVLNDAQLMLNHSPEMQRKLDRLNELSDKIDSGGWNRKYGAYWGAKTGQGKQEDLEEFDKLANELVTDATQKFGARGGAKMAEIIRPSKPTRENSPEGNKRNIESIRKGVTREWDRSDFISEATNDYNISPNKAIQLWSEYEKEAKTNQNASPWKKIDPSRSFNNDQYAPKSQSFGGSGDSNKSNNIETLSGLDAATLKKKYENGEITEQDLMALKNHLKKAA